MLEFFRKKAAYIGLGIVVFFGATMFTGSFFLGGMDTGGAPQQTSKSEQSDFAMAGNIPVNQEKFVTLAGQYINGMIASPSIAIDPELREQLLYRAFLDAVTFTAFVHQAQQSDVTISKEMVNLNVESMMEQSNISSKKELKEMLKQQGVSYKAFLERVKRDNLALMMMESIRNNVNVTNRDVDNKYSKIRFNIIETDSDAQSTTGNRRTADSIYQEIQSGLSFEKAKELYSNALENNVNQWFNYGDLSQKLDQHLFELKDGEVGAPIQVGEKTLIFKLLDKKYLPRSKEFNYDTERQAMLEDEKNRAVQQFQADFIQNNPIEISIPLLQAIHYKIQGKVLEATGAYQRQISQNPLDPTPHFLLAKMYLLVGDKEKAKVQFKWTKLKLSDIEGVKFPFLYLGLLQYYQQESPEDIIDIKSITLDQCRGNKRALEQLKEIAKLIPDQRFKTQINEELDAITTVEIEEK